MSKLTLNNISYQIKKDKIIKNIDFCANSSETTTILGPSGSGKSTLLKLIAGITKASSGKILLNDNDITHFDPDKRKIGYVAQNPSLLPYLNIIDNICLAIDHKKDKYSIARELLKKTKMAKYADKFPKELSVGQQQKISILRALAAKPNILVFDEPYANLDIINKEDLIHQTMDMVKDFDCIKILVTHNPYEAMIASDNIFVLNEGKIIQSGSAKELYNQPKCEFIAHLFGLANIISSPVKSGIAKNSLGDFKIKDKKLKKANIIIRPKHIKSSSRKSKDYQAATIVEKKFYYGDFLYLAKINDNTEIKFVSEKEYTPDQEVFLKIEQYFYF